MAFPPLGYSDHVVVSVSIDFPINSKQDTLFHCVAYDYSFADWDGLRDHLRDVPWEDIFKLSVSAAASEFCEWVQVGIDVYIPHRKYISLIVSIIVRVLEAAKLAYTTTTKESITSQKFGSRDFWRFANSVHNKGKSAIPPLFNGPEVLSCLLHLIKQNYLLKTFPRTQILMTLVSLYLFSLLELI